MVGIGLVLSALVAMSPMQETAPEVVLKSPTITVAPKGVVHTSVWLTFADGLHGYQNPPSDKFQIPVTIVTANTDITHFTVKYPRGVEVTMDGEEKPTLAYEGKVGFPVSFFAPKNPGTYRIPIDVKYQQCTVSTCYPPTTTQLVLTLVVAK